MAENTDYLVLDKVVAGLCVMRISKLPCVKRLTRLLWCMGAFDRVYVSRFMRAAVLCSHGRTKDNDFQLSHRLSHCTIRFYFGLTVSALESVTDGQMDCLLYVIKYIPRTYICM